VTPTQEQVLARLAELTRLLDAATVDVARLDEDAVRAKQAYEVGFASAFLRAEGSVDARRQVATIGVASLALDAELAAAKHRACRERIRTLGIQIDVGRTLSAATRSSWRAEATGQ
jgi:hypothetical protein